MGHSGLWRITCLSMAVVLCGQLALPNDLSDLPLRRQAAKFVSLGSSYQFWYGGISKTSLPGQGADMTPLIIEIDNQVLYDPTVSHMICVGGVLHDIRFYVSFGYTRHPSGLSDAFEVPNESDTSASPVMVVVRRPSITLCETELGIGITLKRPLEDWWYPFAGLSVIRTSLSSWVSSEGEWTYAVHGGVRIKMWSASEEYRYFALSPLIRFGLNTESHAMPTRQIGLALSYEWH